MLFLSIFRCLMLVCFLASFGYVANSQVKESLKGIATLRVPVAPVKSDIEEAGLKTSEIKTAVELKLRKNGIIVKSFDAGAAIPLLYVRVMSVYDQGTFALGVDVSLIQPAVLERDKTKVVLATTWNSGRTGTSGSTKVAGVREWVSDLVDEFLNDFLASNPKVIQD